MNLDRLIQNLSAIKERLEREIALLEELRQTTAEIEVSTRIPKRRGRTSMGESERLEVSARMKRYWAARRGGKEDPEFIRPDQGPTKPFLASPVT